MSADTRARDIRRLRERSGRRNGTPEEVLERAVFRGLATYYKKKAEVEEMLASQAPVDALARLEDVPAPAPCPAPFSRNLVLTVLLTIAGACVGSMLGEVVRTLLTLF